MTISQRISVFENLGKRLHAVDSETQEDLLQRVANENPWFTPSNVRKAISAWSLLLAKENLKTWVAPYKLEPEKEKTVGVVMAGNIPLVGFHDLLSVLISGNRALVKVSSKDTALIKFIIGQLREIEPQLATRITLTEQLKGFDAVIATGSDNTARYFHHYFSKYPNIIRKNRTSCAVLTGDETDEELVRLGIDIFQYFGLGCRNVSKLFISERFDLTKLLDLWQRYQDIIHHHKYNNNYDYQKSILLVNREPFLDNGFLLLRETDRLVSPISVLFYERYSDEGSLALKLIQQKEKTQCIVGKNHPASVSFGDSQNPKLWDYADQINTLEFLSGL